MFISVTAFQPKFKIHYPMWGMMMMMMIIIIIIIISTHLEKQILLPVEQRGCHPGNKWFKDKLMKSKAIYEDCKRRNKNLSIVWIDYQKAFDSIPHSLV
jgi:hypothetical protein